MAVMCLVLADGAVDAAAQLDTATVIGMITDVQGAVLPGATGHRQEVDTGFTRSGISERGALPGCGHEAIPPGNDEVTAELLGFSTTMRRGVRLPLGSESVLNFAIQLAGVAAAVTVTADTPVVETTTTAVQASLNRDQIDVLPLISRDYTSLLRLVPDKWIAGTNKLNELYVQHRIRLTLEAFNLFNIPQRELGSTSITSGSFGIYDYVRQPRAVQVTAQYDW